MNYKIELTDNFKKEAKRLIKKYASYKLKLRNLLKSFQLILPMVSHWVMMFTKFDFQLLLKIKGDQEVQE